MTLPKLSGTASLAELDAIEGHIRRFEGPASAAVMRYWVTRDPLCARVVRDKDGGMLGYTVFIKVMPGDEEARAKDPMLLALDATFESIGKYSVARWFGDCSGFHEVTPVSVGCHIINAEVELSVLGRDLSWHFVLVTNTEAWVPMVSLADFGRFSAVRLDDTHFAFAHDMRKHPLLTWFHAFTRRIMDTLKTGAQLDFGLPTSPSGAIAP